MSSSSDEESSRDNSDSSRAETPLSEYSEPTPVSNNAYELAMEMATGQVQIIQSLHCKLRLLEIDNQQLKSRCDALGDSPMVKELVQAAAATILDKMTAPCVRDSAQGLTQDTIAAMLRNEMTLKVGQQEGTNWPVEASGNGTWIGSLPSSDSDMDTLSPSYTPEPPPQDKFNLGGDLMDQGLESTETAGTDCGWSQTSQLMTGALPHISPQIVWTGSSSTNGTEKNVKVAKSVKRKGEKMKIKQRSKVRRIENVEQKPPGSDNDNNGEVNPFRLHNGSDIPDIEGRRTTRSMTRFCHG